MGKANSTTLPRADIVVMTLEQKQANLKYNKVQGEKIDLEPKIYCGQF